MKVARWNDFARAVPEYEYCQRAAEEYRAPLLEVMAATRAAARRRLKLKVNGRKPQESLANMKLPERTSYSGSFCFSYAFARSPQDDRQIGVGPNRSCFYIRVVCRVEVMLVGRHISEIGDGSQFRRRNNDRDCDTGAVDESAKAANDRSGSSASSLSLRY